jgi:hypothetical protein
VEWSEWSGVEWSGLYWTGSDGLLFACFLLAWSAYLIIIVNIDFQLLYTYQELLVFINTYATMLLLILA